MKRLPPDFESDLQTIAERLYSNHAVVMVGAGFSRNASESYPDWNGLGDLFYSLLHPGESTPKGNYWNVMDLADEVAASKGRSELESIVQNRIGDGKLKPSALHERLLKLPWADVFTTNYDTLLEATLPSLLARRYSVVVTENQLAHAESPRIIKLHGSFPAIRPYVLTTEDYRCYPQTHAAFVNTVRQSFLEHTFCLIGFSGDDPNFLSWAGWLRDNLGDYSKPIYLITMDEPSESRRSLLMRRNIRPVALRHFGDICGNDYDGGYRLFFNYIERCRKDPDRWFDTSRIIGEREVSFSELVQEWKDEHGRYHGKLTVPDYQRELLTIETDKVLPLLGAAEKSSDLELVTDFCYEFFWRLDLSLRPATPQLVTLTDKVFHLWRRRLLRGDIAYPKSKLISVAIQLMRVYRERGERVCWESVRRTIQIFAKQESGSVRDDYYYEVVLSNMSRFESAAALAALNEWDPCDSNPLALARAGILYGMLDDWTTATRFLVDALVAVRKTSAYNNDRRSLQIESVIIRASMFSQMKTDADHFGSASTELQRDLDDRLNDLRRYDCDVRDDLRKFEAFFKTPSIEMFSSKSQVSFDLGPDRVTNTYSRIWQDGYSYMRFCEITGLPLACIKKESYVIALRNLVRQNVVQVIAYLRYQADLNLIDSVLTREALMYLPADVANSAIKRMLADLKTLVSVGIVPKKAETFKVLLQIISRLMCCELTPENRRAAYVCLKLIFLNAERVPPFACVDDFVRRLVRATPIQEMPIAVEMLGELPPVCLKWPFSDSEFRNPVYHILETTLDRSISDGIESLFSNVSVSEARWRRLMVGMDDESQVSHRWYLATAMLYSQLKVLSEQQSKELRSKVFSAQDGALRVDLGDFLDRTIFALIPSETEGLRSWILDRNVPGPWFESNRSNKGYPLSGGASNRINNLYAALDEYKDVLTTEEVVSVLERIEEEWSIAKDLIETNDYGSEVCFMGETSLTEEGFARAFALGHLIGALARCKSSEAITSRVNEFVKYYADVGAPALSMIVKIAAGEQESLLALAPSVVFSLNSSVNAIRWDGRHALIELLKSEDVKVRRRFVEIAISALSWSSLSDAHFAFDIVRSAEKSGLIDLEFVACIFNMVSRWKTYIGNSIRNRHGDDNLVRDIVYLGRIIEIISRSGELNEYRRTAVANMCETIAKPFPFFEVKEAWKFAWR